LSLLESPEALADMAEKSKAIAVPDSAEKLAQLVRQLVEM